MSCRITGKICDAWSDVSGCGLVRCKFAEKKDGGKILNGETVKDRHQMTNADRIRAMTDEELVNVVPCPLGFSMFRCPIERQCGPCKREWLQQPAENFWKKYCPDQKEGDY